MSSAPTSTRIWLPLAALLGLPSCSGIVANLAADALGGGNSFASDDDPELVREAIPFGLKTLESLIQSSPENPKLLLAASSGFTQYAYAFVQTEAEELEPIDLSRARQGFARSKKLFSRAYEYGMRGLEVRHAGFRAAFERDRKKALETTEKGDVPFLYWTAASLGGRISISKDDLTVVGRLPDVEALMVRALALDEAWGDGAIHELLISYESRSESMGGSLKRAKEHYERVLALTNGKKVAPLVTWAESVAISSQDRKLFDELLDKVLAFNVDEAPSFRLVNLIAQRRARFLKERAGDLFLEE
jgi:hypothetical protein